VLVPYALLWSGIVAICLALPVGALVARAIGILTFSPTLDALSTTPLLYFFFVSGVAAFEARRMRRAHGGVKLELRRRGRCIRWVFGFSAAAVIALTLFVDLGDLQPAVVVVAFGAL